MATHGKEGFLAVPGSDFAVANLDRTILTDALLAGADLSRTRNLKQPRIDVPCGAERPQLPRGITTGCVGRCPPAQ